MIFVSRFEVVMADSEDSFRLQNSPTDTEPKDLQNDGKPEKQNVASSKSPSSQTTYIQQVTSSVCVLPDKTQTDVRTDLISLASYS